MAFSLSSRSLENLDGVDERLVRIVHRGLEISLTDFGVPNDGGRRTATEQLALFKAGLSSCDGTVKRSNHQDGRAVDVFAYVNGRASWAPLHMALVACALLQAASELGVRVKWGGLFRSRCDMPHIELDEP